MKDVSNEYRISSDYVLDCFFIISDAFRRITLSNMRDRALFWEETSKPFQNGDGVTVNSSIFFVPMNELAAIFLGKPIISFSLGKLEHNFCGFATKNKIYYTLFGSGRYTWFINNLKLRNWNKNST